MKTYLADIIPKIQRFSQKLDNLTLLTNQHWVVVDEINRSKTVYIFRQGGELLISQDGKVERARWEYLGNNSLLIDRKDESYLFRHGFFDENILALKVDGKDEFAFLVNETRYDGELNSVEAIFALLYNNYVVGRDLVGKESSFPRIEPYYSDITTTDLEKVASIKPYLKSGQVITKNTKNGRVQRMTYYFYNKWIESYGSDSLIILAQRD